MAKIARIVSAIAFAFGLCQTDLPVAGAAPPNIVFVLADDLGIHDLACYGRSDHHTPHLDRLATEGTRFTSAYCAQPICSPSRAAIVTGIHPARLHLTTYLPGRPDCRSQPLLHPAMRQQLPLEEKTLAEHLGAAGYATACIGKWHLGGAGFGPGEQGFDLYYAGHAVTEPSDSEGGKGEYDLTAHAERFIEAQRERPFLLYLAHNSPHIPYAARPATVARHGDAFEPVYAAVIETLDDTVGRLLQRIEDLGLKSNTIVVFTSDNGGLHVPEGPHGRITYNTPYRAGKGFLYEGGLRIPLIVRWPGHVPANRIVDGPVVNTDWLPTLLDLADLPVPQHLDGVSLRACLTEGTDVPTRTLCWHFPHYTNQGSRPGGAIRDGDWKLVEHYEDESVELYNLADDPREANNLADDQPQRTATLRGHLAAWRRDLAVQTNRPNPQFDPQLHRALYKDLDVSSYRPEQADPATQELLGRWRRQMNAATRP